MQHENLTFFFGQDTRTYLSTMI